MSGIVGYARRRPVWAGCGAALIGAASLGSAAQAADDSAAAAVDTVVVTGKRNPLDTGTGLATALTTVQDTPQAITVIDGAQLKNQGVGTLEQALRNVPGITVAIGEGGTLSGDQFKIRGFDSKDDVYIDGLRDFGAYTRDSFNYEEVQVLKGPSGAMFGRGSTGGAINTLSKRPRLENAVSLDAYAGSGDYRRGLADINRRLGGTTALRVSLMGHDAGVVDRDLIYARRWGAAVTLATGLGTDTTAQASFLHQHGKSRPDYGIIIVQRPGEIVARPASEYGVGVERSTFTGYRNDVDRGDADIATIRLSHRVSDKVSLTSDTRYGVYSRYFQYSTLDQCQAACTAALFDGNPATEAFGGNGGQGPYDMDARGLQNITTLRLDRDLGPLRNQLILGIDLSRQANDKAIFAYALPAGFTTRPAIPRPLVNPTYGFPAGYQVFRAVPGQNITCPSSGNCTTVVNGATVFTNTLGTATARSHGVSTDAGVFLTDRLWLNARLSVIGSLRLDRYHAELKSLFFNNNSADIAATSTLRSPRLSLVFEPAPGSTVYASWGRSETPQGTSIVGAGAALAVTTKDLAPEVSRILEAGAKVMIPGTQLSATASVFRIRKGNALQTDPATGFLQAQSGEKQAVQGLELGLTGRPTPNWTLSLGYAYLDATIRESFVNCTVAAASATGVPAAAICPLGVTAAIPVLNTVAVDRQVIYVPRHSASAYTTYDLSRVVDGLSVGGDVVFQGLQKVVYQPRSVSFADRATLTPLRLGVVPKSVTLNAFVTYRTGPYRFSVNAYNLTNRLNYSQVFSNRATPAAGRTLIFALGASF